MSSKYVKPHKKYIRYSDQQLSEARKTDMVNFLEQHYGFTFKKAGRYYICKEHDSLIVKDDGYKRTEWHWNSKNDFGLDVIDWLQKIELYDFQSACKYIIGDVGEYKPTLNQNPKVSVPVKKETEKKLFKLPEPVKDKYSKVFAYLNKTRGIDKDIIKYCFDKKLIYQDIKGNCIFVGYDNENIPRFAERKLCYNPNGYPPINIEGAEKEMSFHITTENGIKDRVFVFEAPVDLLSHATFDKMLAEIRGEDSFRWTKHNRLSLSGTSDVALADYLKRNPEIKRIVLCLDNDKSGRKATEKITDKYTKLGYSIRVQSPREDCKDWNEMLVSYIKSIKTDTLDITEENTLSR